jgi:hypothetical protein
MEEDYEGGETNGTQKTHSYPSSCLSLTQVRITAEKNRTRNTIKTYQKKIGE